MKSTKFAKSGHNTTETDVTISRFFESVSIHLKHLFGVYSQQSFVEPKILPAVSCGLSRRTIDSSLTLIEVSCEPLVTPLLLENNNKLNNS